MKSLKNYSLLIISILIILVIIYVVTDGRPFHLISNFHFNMVEESKDEESHPRVNKFLQSISESASKK